MGPSGRQADRQPGNQATRQADRQVGSLVGRISSWKVEDISSGDEPKAAELLGLQLMTMTSYPGRGNCANMGNVHCRQQHGCVAGKSGALLHEEIRKAEGREARRKYRWRSCDVDVVDAVVAMMRTTRMMTM